MEKLELKHLAPYLPYGLKGSYDETFEIETLIGFCEDEVITNVEQYPLKDFKPILRPLSDLTKEVRIGGKTFIPKELLEARYYTLDLHAQCDRIIEDSRWINQCDYMLIQHLLEWHFDVFGLIEKGLAIDINTIK